jgi:hypothetical protein
MMQRSTTQQGAGAAQHDTAQRATLGTAWASRLVHTPTSAHSLHALHAQLAQRSSPQASTGHSTARPLLSQ